MDKVFNLTGVLVPLAREVAFGQLEKGADVFADVPREPEEQQMLGIGDNADESSEALLRHEPHLPRLKRWELDHFLGQLSLAGQAKGLALEDLVVIAAAVDEGTTALIQDVTILQRLVNALNVLAGEISPWSVVEPAIDVPEAVDVSVERFVAAVVQLPQLVPALELALLEFKEFGEEISVLGADRSIIQ